MIRNMGHNLGLTCWDVLNYMFKAFCGIIAVFMVGFWIIKFDKNEDISAIEYISYENNTDIIYPELSICIVHPFIYPQRWNANTNVTPEEYSQYINGTKAFREEYRKIDFDLTTLNLLEFIQQVSIYMRNQAGPKNSSHGGIQVVDIKNNFNGFTNGLFNRCFGFKTKSKILGNIQGFHVIFKPSLIELLDQIYKTGYGMTYVVFNYPGQALRSFGNIKPIWKTPNDTVGLFSIKISTLEILKRRNKKRDPCFSDWESFDERVLKKHHDTIGCCPPYQTSSHPLCTSMKEISQSRYEIYDVRNKYFPAPCEEMSNIVFTADELPFIALSNILQIYIGFPDRIKVINQRKSVDLHSLIGNIGGYIGLFLGKYFFIRLVCSYYMPFLIRVGKIL